MASDKFLLISIPIIILINYFLQNQIKNDTEILKEKHIDI